MGKIINIMGAAGVGKSTYAALLFAKMKQAGFDCELVTEYAKEIVYSDNKDLLDDQLVILTEQYKRLNAFEGVPDYIITDSPLLMASVYNKKTKHPYSPPEFEEICFQAFNKFNNLNIVLLHGKYAYTKRGRRETLQQSLEVQNELLRVIKKGGLHCAVNPEPDQVVEYLKFFEKLKAEKARKQKEEGSKRLKKLFEDHKDIFNNFNQAKQSPSSRAENLEKE